MYKKLLILCLAAAIGGCTNINHKENDTDQTEVVSEIPSVTSTESPIESTSNNEPPMVIIDSLVKINFGSTKVITGDFDGDGKREKLVEHYVSRNTGTDIEKFYYSGTPYSELVNATAKKKPRSYLLSDNKTIDTLSISSAPQLFGIFFLKNEGDLNNDGSDEVSYVVDWADRSAVNTYYIVTYKNGKWTKLASFRMWEWQFDDVPSNQGLIKKTGNSEIEYYGSGEEYMLDTMSMKLTLDQ